MVEASTNEGRNKPSKGWLTPMIAILTCCAVVGVAAWFSLENGWISAPATPRFNQSSIAPTMLGGETVAPATSTFPLPTSSNTNPPSQPPTKALGTEAPTREPMMESSMAPTQAPVLIGNPTGGPTKVPSNALSPISVTSSSPTPQSSVAIRRDAFIAMVEASLPSFNSSALMTSSTRQALDWLLLNDTMAMDLFDNGVAADESRLLQRFALACYWFSTNGPADGWLFVFEEHPSWMSTKDHECTWGGVSCDDADTIVGLSHSSYFGTTLEGALPPELGLLSSLVDLDLRAVSLAGTIPTEVGHLSKLTSIDISHDYTSDLPGRLEGQLPVELFYLRDLRTIRLGRNSIKGTLPTEVGLLSNLEILMLQQNEIGGKIPTELGLCTSLRALGLGDNSFSGSIPSELLVRDISSYFGLYGNPLTGSIPCNVFTQVEIDCGEISCPGGCCCQGFDDYSCSEAC